MKECPFCDGVSGLSRLTGMGAEDLIVAEATNFRVIPDIAPIVEGHVLIVTREHIPSLGAVSPEHMGELLETKIRLGVGLAEAYEKPMFFEHGASASRKAGSSVDHAHLHCLPVPKGLRLQIGVPAALDAVSGVDGLRKYWLQGLSYIYYEGRDDEAIVLPVGEGGGDIPSQLMRKKAAEALGVREWNWRERIKTHEYASSVAPKISRTAAKLRNALSRR
jgi:diadenosine tetraphosphate (Ap4A) HIT family hydrolase